MGSGVRLGAGDSGSGTRNDELGVTSQETGQGSAPAEALHTLEIAREVAALVANGGQVQGEDLHQ